MLSILLLKTNHSLRSWRDCLREVRAAEPRREWPRAAYAAHGGSATKTLPSHTIPPATQAKTNYGGSKLALVRYDYWFSFDFDF